MGKTCTWIEGEPIPAEGQSHDDLFCGAPCKPGSSYCPEHHAICFIPYKRQPRQLGDGQWTKRGRAA